MTHIHTSSGAASGQRDELAGNRLVLALPRGVVSSAVQRVMLYCVALFRLSLCGVSSHAVCDAVQCSVVVGSAVVVCLAFSRCVHVVSSCIAQGGVLSCFVFVSSCLMRCGIVFVVRRALGCRAVLVEGESGLGWSRSGRQLWSRFVSCRAAWCCLVSSRVAQRGVVSRAVWCDVLSCFVFVSSCFMRCGIVLSRGMC